MIGSGLSTASELATIRNEVAELAKILAATNARVALLKSRLEQLKRDHPTDESEPRCRLPAEIWREVARHCQPGSRSLLNLASTSKDFYALLRPELVRTFTSDLSTEAFFKFSFQQQDFVAKHVKHLQFSPLPVHKDTLVVASVVGRMLDICTNVTTLDFQLGQKFDWMSLRQLQYPHVRTCIFRDTPDQIPVWLARLCPNVEHLTINAHEYAKEGSHLSAAFWEAANTRFKRLSKLTTCFRGDLEFLHDLPDLVSKIDKYTASTWQSLVDLCYMAAFRPTEIDVSDLEWPEERESKISTAIWPALSSLHSLRKLTMGSLWTWGLCMGGFPPNLETWTVDRLWPATLSGKGIELVRSSVPASLKHVNLRVHVKRCPARSDPSRPDLVNELVFWRSVTERGKGSWGFYTPEGDEELNKRRNYEVETDVWRSL